MEPQRIEAIFRHLANDFSLSYDKLVEQTYHLLPKEFVTNYNRTSIYKKSKS